MTQLEDGSFEGLGSPVERLGKARIGLGGVRKCLSGRGYLACTQI